ncbi:MAG: hypothetical protein ACTSUE_27225 [Promethearchaeota archaeon]
MTAVSRRREFVPSADFIHLVATSLEKFWRGGHSRGAIIDESVLNGISRNQIGKFYKYFNSIIGKRDILNFILERVEFQSKSSILKGTVEYYVILTLIYHAFEGILDEWDFSRSIRRIPESEMGRLEHGSGNSTVGNGVQLSDIMDDFYDNIGGLELGAVLQNLDWITKTSLKFSHTRWFVEKMLQLVSRVRTTRILRSHVESKTFFIMARDRSSLQQLRDFLNAKSFTNVPDPGIQNFISVKNKPGWKRAVITSNLYRDGKIAFIDRGSIAVIQALNPGRDDVILDVCSAPFQKAMVLSWRLGNRGCIVANDLSTMRILTNKGRLGKGDKHRIGICNTDGTTFFDAMRLGGIRPTKILIDAPCTGSGSLMSSPELKWRQEQDFLDHHVGIQERLVHSAIRFCKEHHLRDTEIIYSTCSYFPEEGEGIIDRFLPGIELVNLHEGVGQALAGPDYSFGWKNHGCSKYVVRTFPDLQSSSKGFFIAKFRIKGGR